MTAEVAILNKNAVALAADSAVTLRNPETQKVYNTANKLFMLSKYHPVGIMVYGPASLMGVPWETVIKIYREELFEKNFDHLAGFAEDFLAFLERSRLLFPESTQSEAFTIDCAYPLWAVRQEIDRRVKSIIEKVGAANDQDVQNIVTETVQKHLAEWSNYRRLPCFPDEFEAHLIAKEHAAIDRLLEDNFGKLPIGELREPLARICAYRVTKDWWRFDSGGVVIAGFGKDDVFPVLYSYMVENIIDGKLKSDRRDNQNNDVNQTKGATIVPFAQGEIVYRFIQGMDPEYKRELTTFLNSLLTVEYPAGIVEKLAGQIPEAGIGTLREDLQQLGKEIVNGLWKKWENWEHQKFVGPVLDIVGDLPKDDLAAMAESLVNLTSFKRRITAEMETVGGPIDVAVISKGDGFVWIKRKHYFEKDLNPGFFAKYYRREK
jgi:hypothetical protein